MTDLHREYFEERAAIFEYLGGMTREQAERAAWQRLAVAEVLGLL